MIDGEKMRRMVKLLLVTNVICFIALVTVFGLAASNKHKLEQCQIELQIIH